MILKGRDSFLQNDFRGKYYQQYRELRQISENGGYAPPTVAKCWRGRYRGVKKSVRVEALGIRVNILVSRNGPSRYMSAIHPHLQAENTRTRYFPF